MFRVHSTPEGDAAALQGLNLRVGDGEVVTVLGPSGSGKSTLLRRLWQLVPEVVAFDGDVLWHASFWNDRRAFYDRWLALAGQASQSARAVAVLTAAMPDDWRSDFAVLVADVHMLALVCDEDELTARLAARERPVDDEAPRDFLEQTRTFDRWLRTNVDDTVDTSAHDRDEVAEVVAAWIRERL